MANIKITDLDAYANPDSTDVLPIVDVGADETKKVSIADLMENAGAGAEATPGIAFDGDPDTGIYRPAANQLAFSTGGTQRILIDDSGVVTVAGDLTVNGTTTTVNSTTVTVDDKNIELGSVGTPTDTTADGGGITLKGATDKTLNWVNSTDSWTSSENVDLASGKTYKIAGTDVLSATALGSAVQISSDNIPSGTIVNDDVNASAAIAGTKIDPDFGSQTVETTGVFSAAGGAQGTPSITFTGDLNTGIYSPGADQVAISTGGTGRLFVNASGRVGVNESSPLQALHVAGNIYTANDFMTRNGGGIFLSGSGSYNTGILDSSGALVARTGGAERLRIDSSGRLLVGTSTARSSTGAIQVETAGTTDRSRFEAFTNINSPAGPHITLGKSRGTTAGSNTIVQVSDEIGALNFHGTDGANDIRSAQIKCVVDGTPGTNDMPGRLVFSTNGGASSVTERMRIDSSGRVGVGTTSAQALFHVKSTATQSNIGIFETGGGTLVIRTQSANSGEAVLNAYQGSSTTTAAPFVIQQAGNERLRIDSSGRVGVGTSSPGSWSSYTNNLVVRESGNDPGGITIATNSGYAGYLGFSDTSNTSSQGWIGYRHDNATEGLELAAGSSARMYITSAGNVGVGTTSPDSELHISKADTTTKLILERTNSATAKWSMSAGGGSLLFRDEASSNERVRIDSSGRVGIGTSSPTHNLTIGSTAASDFVLSLRGGVGGFLGWDDSANCTILQAPNTRSLQFRVNSDTFSAGTMAMHINSSGNVGIGTTSPQTQFVVSNGGAQGLEVGWDGSTSQYLQAYNRSGSAWIPIRIQGSDIRFNISGSSNEKARIDSSGRLLVGTSTSPTDSINILAKGPVGGGGGGGCVGIGYTGSSGPGSGATLGVLRFTANGNSTHSEIRARQDGATWTDGSDQPSALTFSTTLDGASSPTERVRISNGGRFGVFSADNNGGADISVSFGAGTANRIIRGRHSATGTYTGTTSFEVLSNGNVNNTNNSYGALSDIKLKENIVNASSQWDDLKSIQVRNYNFKEGQTHTQIGVVAQEVELVSPGLVTESPDKDDEGNDLGTTTKSVNYSVLYMKAVKALQEAMERIETLEAKVAALEAN